MLTVSIICAVLIAFSLANARYEPNWESLDARTIPEWYDQAKFGIILHWGVYSVPSYGGGAARGQSEWFWFDWLGRKQEWAIDFLKHNYVEDFTYPDFAPSFTAELFDPDEWADLFQTSGARCGGLRKYTIYVDRVVGQILDMNRFYNEMHIQRCPCAQNF